MAAKKDLSDRVVSLQKAAQILDRDRNTLSKWLQQGCPAIERGDAPGQSWKLDLAEIVRWLERRAASEVAGRLGSDAPEGAITIEEAKRRKAIAEAVQEQIEASERLGTVVRWSTVTDRIAAEYAEVRARLTPLGDQIAARLPKNLSATAKSLVDELVRNALASLKTDAELNSRS